MTTPRLESAFTSTRLPRTAFVAMIDVLGFKNRLQNTELSTLNEEYRNLINLATEFNDVPVISPNGIEMWSFGRAIFSDTILFAADDGWCEVQTLISAVAQLMKDALQSGWPLRGAIAYGSCILDVNDRVFIGQPIVDAYLAEQSQEWVGIGIHSSVFDHPKFGAQISTLQDVIRYHVPVKTDKPAIDYAVHWGPYSNGAVSSLGRMMQSVECHNDRIKYKATIDYINATCADMHAAS